MKKIHLVACMMDGSEPLGLHYLAAALDDAGFETGVHTFRHPADLEAAARTIAADSSPLVGVSLPSGHAALHAVAFVHRLRELGYHGHVTCGGPYATLCRGRLLDTVEGIDSVVRHDGEVPIVDLARRLIAGECLEGLHGVTTRRGDGPPVQEPDEVFGTIMPRRSPPMLYAGVPAAKIAAARGCDHGCRYCGLAALHRQRGHVGIRRRPAAHVAEEMAELYHERGVRFFHFVDENHLPGDETEAVQVIRELDAELSRRGVEKRALSLMLRADAATAPVVGALADLGVVRSLLGVESMTRESLGALGRGSVPEVNIPAMDRMERHGILFHFNVLLIHPDSTMELIRRDVASLQAVRGGLLDPFQVEVFEGTRLFERLEREGKLEGGPFVWDYELEDREAEAYARLFWRVKTGVMGRVPLTTFAYDVLSTFAVARRIGILARGERRLDRQAATLVEQHNRLWLRVLEGIDEHASASRRAQEAFLGEATREAARLTLAFELFRNRVESSCSGPLRCDFALPGTAAAVAISLAILGAGCSRTQIVGDADIGPTEVLDTEDLDAVDVPEEGCGPGDLYDEMHEIRMTAFEAGCTPLCDVRDTRYLFILDDAGHLIDIELEGGDLPEDILRCYLDALAGQTFPCLAEAEIPYWVDCFTPLL